MDIKRQKWIWLVLPLVAGLVTPSLVIVVLDIFFGGTPVVRAVASVLARQFAPGDNLFLIAAVGSIPFVVLSLVLLIGYRGKNDRDRLPWLSIAGTIGALALMIPAHVEVWLPFYTGGDVSSTAVIAFLLIPFLCCVTMMIGLVIGAVATRSRRIQTAAPLG